MAANPSRSAASRRSSSKLFVTLLCLAALLSLAWSLRFTLWLPWHDKTAPGGDFSAYYMAGYCAWRGVDLYDHARVRELARGLGIDKGPPRFGYPPFTALLFLPLAARLGPMAAFRTCLVAYHVLLWVSVFLVLGAIHCRLTLARLAAVVLSVAWFAPIWDTLQSGQINMLILFLAALALFAWPRSARAASGALFGIAAAIKLFPGLTVLYFLLRRHGRALIAMTIAVALFTGASLIILGFDVHRRYVTEEIPHNASKIHGGNHNVALDSLIYRALHPGKLTQEVAAASWSGRYATLIARLLILTATCLLLFFPLRDEPATGLARLSLVLTAAMMVNAWTWTNHLVLALPCLAVAGRRVLTGSAPLFRPGGLLLLLAYLLMAIGYRLPLPTNYGSPLGRELLRSSSLNLYGLLLLWTLLAFGITRGRDGSR